MAQTLDIESRIEGVARYLGDSYPTAGIERYDDSDRGVVGFRFIGGSHGNVEFEYALLANLPADVNGVAQECHLLHAGAEINETPPGDRVVFAVNSVRHEHGA